MTTTSTATGVRGPDPEQFRTSYYGARWYIDPLPADTTWPATNEKWPSVTTIKKAWTKPFRKKLPTGDTVPLDAYWAAEFTVDNLDAITALAADKPAAMALICGAGARTLNRAAERGGGVHTILEELAAGKTPDLILTDPAVTPYIPACQKFITDLQPTWVATEFVVINRTLGFGGTGDAIVIIDIPGAGRYVALTDWKSRGGNHGCYEEEVAQIGGYTLAEYLIVEGPDRRPARVPLPDLDGGLVVSLNHDGYQAYPIDLEHAQAAFRAMHASWREQRDGQKIARRARQHPLLIAGPHSTPPPAPEAEAGRMEWIRSRVLALKEQGHIAEVAAGWPDGVPTLKQGGLTDGHVDQIAAMLDRIEGAHGAPFGASDPLYAGFDTADQAPAPAPEPAPVVDPKAEAKANTATARTLLEQLDPAEQAAVRDLVIPNGAATTARHLEHIEAVCAELTDPNGTVIFTYSTVGTAIEATDNADRVRRGCRTKTEARLRGARLAQELGRPTPRTFDHLCVDPLLAALVAAGHGQPDTNNPTNPKE